MKKIILVMTVIMIIFESFFMLVAYANREPEMIPVWTILLAVFSSAVIAFAAIIAFSRHNYADVSDVFPDFVFPVVLFIAAVGFYLAAVHTLLFIKFSIQVVLFILLAIEFGLFGKDSAFVFAKKNNLVLSEVLGGLAAECIFITIPFLVIFITLF